MSASGQTEKSRQRDGAAGSPSTAVIFEECLPRPLSANCDPMHRSATDGQPSERALVFGHSRRGVEPCWSRRPLEIRRMTGYWNGSGSRFTREPHNEPVGSLTTAHHRIGFPPVTAIVAPET